MANPSKTSRSVIYQIDKFTKQQSIMQADHTYIHAGIGFTIAVDLGSISAATHIGFTTPAAGNYLHFRPASAMVTTSADSVEYQLREGITSFASGSAYTPFNRNRNNSNTSGVTILTTTTPVIGSPTLLDTFYVGTAGNPATRSGGAGGGGEEIIFKPATDYLFTFTPAGATDVTFSVFWYEEEVT